MADADALAYKVVGFPHLGMRLIIGCVYTVSELELRCGNRNEDRRALLYQKLKDRSCFKPASLQSALGRKKPKTGKDLPLWAKAPVLHSDEENVGRRRSIANNLAKSLLLKLDETSEKVTEEHVQTVLKTWGFARNTVRKNVLPKGKTFVHSDTLGLNCSRDHVLRVTGLSRQYQHVTKLLVRWLRNNWPEELPSDFPFTSISVNSNYAAARHRDGNNEGPSLIRAFGKFTGGELRYWPRDNRSVKNVKKLHLKDAATRDIRSCACVFDGRRAHEVTAFKGTRWSLVFFTCGKYDRASGEVQSTLDDLGFQFPTAKALKKASRVVSQIEKVL